MDNTPNKSDYVDKLVVNLSSYKLTQAEKSLLSKGLNFCPTPGEPELGDIRNDLDIFHRDLRRKAFNLKINKPENIRDVPLSDSLDTISDEHIEFADDFDRRPPFKHYQFKNKSLLNPPGPKIVEEFISLNNHSISEMAFFAPLNKNLIKEEQKALQSLKNNTDIVIKPADKGGAVVVQDRQDYVNEGLRQLADVKVYKILENDKSLVFLQEISRFLEYCVREGEIDKQILDYLTNFEPRTSRLYFLPKIHKKTLPPPGRPVVSANGCATERISEFVDFFLKPYVQKTKSYIKDSTDFLRKLDAIKQVPCDSILFTLDVVSLYTNIPTNMGIQFISDFLENKRCHSDKPSNKVIIKLLEYVLTMNNFIFDSKHYLQVSGTAIGTKVAPSFANLVVAIFEEQFVYEYPDHPLWWFRFIDDISGCWTGSLNSLQKFVEYLNKQIDTLKFTLEYSYTDISFLDIRVIKETDGTLSTDLYKKDTDARNYLLYSSYHPLSCKQGIPYGQFLRVRKVCSNLDRFDRNAIDMAKSFLLRGYPPDLIESSLIRARRVCRSTLLVDKHAPIVENKGIETYFIQTFNAASPKINGVIRKHLPLLTKNPALRGFNELKITYGYRRPKNLKDYLVRAELKPQQTQKSTRKPCWNPTKCRYCPKINTKGRITSNITGREYMCKTNVNCQSSNLIYAIQCKVCNKQYVGQTGNRVMDRFQGHFGSIGRNANETLISFHFNSKDHNGIDDVEIFILDFIQVMPKSNKAKYLRLKIESNWIQRLRSTFPSGLNSIE